jgi:hypothetical protein
LGLLGVLGAIHLPKTNRSMKKRIVLQLLGLLLLTTPICAQTNVWQEDLAKVYQLVMENSGHIFKHYEYNEWVEDYTTLLKKSPALSKNEIRVELMGLIAKLQDGHSGIWIREMVFPEEETKWFPIRMYYFEEGLYVIASDAKYSEYIGGKVERFGNLSEAEASKKLFEIANGENKYGDMFKTPFLMIYPPILAGLGLIDDMDRLPLTIRLSNGTIKQIQITSQSYTGGVGGFFDQFESPSPNSVRLDKKFNIKWPSTKWAIEPPYRLEYLEEKGTLYFQLNVLRDPPNYSLMDTYAELWDIVENKKVDKLIIDLRNNGGGNLNNGWPFIFKLKEFPRLNEEKKLIVLTGRKTFSAATAFMSMLETHTNATFIGEPSGGRPNQTEGSPVFPPPVLENVGVDVMLSRGSWTHTNPLDNREYIEPDILILESITDWLEGVDSAYNEAINLK